MQLTHSLQLLVPITALLLFLPGHLTQVWFIARWPLFSRRKWLEAAFISLLFSLCLTGWLALVLVEFGLFNATRLLVLVAAYCVVMGFLINRQGKRGFRESWCVQPEPGDRWTWLFLTVLLVAATLFFHPHEYVLGGSDAGVYVNLGAHITRTGSLPYQDPELAGLDPAAYPGLFREQPSHLLTRYIQFPGFYLSDTEPGTVIPQFYPLHSVWLAIFHSLGGLRASLYATPLWGVLACLAVGLTAATLYGRRTGVLAATMLALSATQIWFSRYPTSEALTQLLLFGGIYAFSRYAVEQSPLMGILAGLSLGQVMLVRVDTYFLLAIPVLWVAYLRLIRRLERRQLVFLIPFLAMSLQSLAHGRLQSWPYLYNSYNWQLERLPLSALAAVGGIFLAGFIILDVWVGGRAQRLCELRRWVSRGATALATLVVLAALYAYFVRPGQANLTANMPYWYGEYIIPYVEPYNLVRLGWYLSPLGIALAVLGVWWMLRRDLSQQTVLFLGLGLFFSFLFLENSRNNPKHIYVMRRYVPMVIPAFAIAAAYAIERWWCRSHRLRWLALGVAVVQMALLLYGARSVVRQVDHQGIVAQLTPWVESLDSNAIILFDDDQPVSAGATVGTALRFLYGRTVFDLQEEFLEAETLEKLVRSWQTQGRPVLVAVGSNAVREPFANWSVTPLPSLSLDTTVLEESYLHFPRQVLRSRLELELYELQPRENAVLDPLRIDVGSSDFFYLGEGWYGKERLPDQTTVRWTSGAAQIHLPSAVTVGGDVRLQLQMALPADVGEPLTSVRMRHETSTVAEWQVGKDFAVYEATWTPSSFQDGPPDLWLETDTWNPAALGLNMDSRDLGVMVDWISVE